MKKLPVIIAMMSTAFVSNAFAVSGSINFTGAVSATVCSINDVAGSGSDVGSIDFGTIHSDKLLTVNARSTPEPFSITFSNCPSSEAPKITFSGDSVDMSGMTLASGIENVGILIADGDNETNTYQLNVARENTGFTEGWSRGDNVITGNFTATPVSMSEGVKTGSISSTVTFVVDYSDV